MDSCTARYFLAGCWAAATTHPPPSQTICEGSPAQTRRNPMKAAGVKTCGERLLRRKLVQCVSFTDPSLPLLRTLTRLCGLFRTPWHFWATWLVGPPRLRLCSAYVRGETLMIGLCRYGRGSPVQGGQHHRLAVPHLSGVPTALLDIYASIHVASYCGARGSIDFAASLPLTLRVLRRGRISKIIARPKIVMQIARRRVLNGGSPCCLFTRLSSC